MIRLTMLVPVLALLGAGCAHAADQPQYSASAGAIPPSSGSAPDGLVGRGLEQLGQQALIHVPDPAQPCRFDILMERQDGRPSVWQNVDLCHTPEPRPPRAAGAATAGQ